MPPRRRLEQELTTTPPPKKPTAYVVPTHVQKPELGSLAMSNELHRQHDVLEALHTWMTSMYEATCDHEPDDGFIHDGDVLGQVLRARGEHYAWVATVLPVNGVFALSPSSGARVVRYELATPVWLAFTWK